VTVPRRFWKRALLEYVEYDSSLARWLIAVGGASIAVFWGVVGEPDRKFRLMCRLHRNGGSGAVTRWVERTIGRLTRLERQGHSTGLFDFYGRHVATAAVEARPDLVRDPTRMLGHRVLVVKSPQGRERGVIVVDYSYVFPLFDAFFDLAAIAERYTIVLEPSWRGLCSEDLLAFSRHPYPVFVETIEPRDVAFLEAIGANFVVVPTAANWWVDFRKMATQEGATRDIDVIMIAGWYELKRHWRFFKVLAELKRRGHVLKVVLVGYPQGLTLANIEADARALGVLDMVTFFDSVNGDEVGQLLQRSKVSVLWSRKEGANRSIVESLFADVPIIVRDGLSYGYRYPYINDMTGRFASEHNLGDVILETLADRARFRPREWALANMTCHRAASLVSEAVRAVAVRQGEPWTTGIVTKVVMLDAQAYWDPSDRARFAADYDFLRSCLRSSPHATARPADPVFQLQPTD